MDLFLMSLDYMRVYKLRVLLTVLGISIGVAALMIVVTIGKSGQKEVISQLETFGVNRFGVYINDTVYENNYLTLEDADVLKKYLISAKAVSPVVFRYTEASYKNRNISVELLGVGVDFFKIQEVELIKGRLLKDYDIFSSRNVAIIDDDVEEKFFKGENPLGKKMLIKDSSFTVIGVVKSNNSNFINKIMGRNNIYIPVTSSFRLYNSKWIDQIAVTTYNREDIEVSIEQTKSILIKRHGGQNIFSFYNLDKEIEAAKNIVNIFKLVISVVAAVSLLVGGIGIMNIMLISVNERTKEIGLKISLGAKYYHILYEFLLEAVILGLLGGFFGILLGMLGTFMFFKIIGWELIIPINAILIGILFSVLTGVFFGIYPAKKAAHLSPIEALRYE